MSASSYPLINDFAPAGDDTDSITVSPHWVLCVVRLGLPLSFSRAQGKSVTTDSSQGARLRGDNLIIVSDCIGLTVVGAKEQHTKSLQVELKQTEHNYLTEILPGDWVLAWIVNDETTFLDLLEAHQGRTRRSPATASTTASSSWAASTASASTCVSTASPASRRRA
jgi:hypothetical protein